MDQALTPLNSQTPAVPAAGVAAPAGPLGRLAALPARSKVMLAAGTAGLLAVLVALLLWGNGPDYKLLYSNLSDKDGGAVLAALQQMNVPYRHGEGGALLVPADKVHDVRLKLASAGLPKGSIVGFELMDTARFGQTQFQERMTFQRALEGELTRSIMSLGSVESARVHLALPQNNGFFREQQKPSASVLLTLHPGRSLERSQVAGIVHLVASSVPEMNPKAVSVLDQSGALLSGPEGSLLSQSHLDAQQLQYVRQVEHGLQQRVIEILEPVVGRENLRATVAAELDFSQTESTAELFRPNQGSEPAAVRSLHSTEAVVPGASAPPAGVPGAMSNQPLLPGNAVPPPNSASAVPNLNMRRENVVNYEVDKTVRVTRNATGVVKRLNAAVVVNYRSVTDPKGKASAVAPSQEELEKLTALVQESIGFNRERGDSVRVVSAPFKAPVADTPEALPLWQQPWVLETLRNAGWPLALVAVAAMLLLGLVRPALRPLRQEPQALPPPGSQLDAVVADDTPLPLPDETKPAAPKPALPGEPTDQLEHARELTRQNPAVVANILRGWLNNEPPAN